MFQHELQRPMIITGHLIAVDPLTVSPKADRETHYLPSSGTARAYIPSSTLRHAIRVAAFRAVRDALAESGKTLPPDMALLLYNGSGERELKTALGWREEQALRNINPFVSLFGLWKLQAKLSVGNAYGYKGGFADPANTVARRANIARKVPESQDIAATPLFTEYLQHLDGQAKQEREANEVEAAQKNKNAKGSKLSVATLVDGWEEFIAGSRLDWRVSLSSPDAPFLLPLLVAAFQYMSFEPWLGGHKSAGCGQYAVELHHGASEIIIQDDMVFRATGLFQDALDQFREQAKIGFSDFDFASLNG